jgi:hypothetical protein
MSCASFGGLLAASSVLIVVSADTARTRNRLNPIVSAVPSMLNGKVKHGVVAAA